MKDEFIRDRKAQKLIDGKWVDYAFMDIKLGDTVRLLESDGEVVTDDDCPDGIFTALCDAYENDGVGFVESEMPAAK